ncbi:hypothetical protein GJ496_009965 [Pomphorhynchus laevis]|nr:hypothetical protein GJ496_009965 [Pomphorhynchus laevis]
MHSLLLVSDNADRVPLYYLYASSLELGFVKATGENPYFDQYELQRRSLGYNIDELRFYLDAVLTHIEKNAEISLTITKDNVADRMRHIVALFRNLQNVDGYDLYREKEAAKIKSLITSRFIEYQTTPYNNVVGCKINIPCGFGCHMHHVLYCATFAYNTQRRLILDTNSWSYGNKEAFSQILKRFQSPLLNILKSQYTFDLGNLSNPAIELGLFEDLSPRPDFIPLAIPNHLSKSTMILSLHGNPFTLYAGHLIRSVLSIQPEFQQIVDDAQNRFNFSSPVVGIHVRRTDKIGTEARFYHLENQLSHNHIAIEDHTQSGDISFVKGDIIGIDFNNWNGYCKGTNKRTNEMGLFPCYKTVDQFLTAP